MKKSGRESSFWQESFLVAYRELLRRAPAGDKVLPGPRIAHLACNMADDCEYARADQAGPCEECRGVGCEACKYTGKAGAGEGLHAAPVERALSLVSSRSAEDDQGAIPSALDALSSSIAQADRDTEVKRRERFAADKTAGDPES